MIAYTLPYGRAAGVSGRTYKTMDMTMRNLLKSFCDAIGVFFAGLAEGLLIFKATVFGGVWAMKLMVALVGLVLAIVV